MIKKRKVPALFGKPRVGDSVGALYRDARELLDRLNDMETSSRQPEYSSAMCHAARIAGSLVTVLEEATCLDFS